MHEIDGSTLYLMDDLKISRDTKTAPYFWIFHIVLYFGSPKELAIHPKFECTSYQI